MKINCPKCQGELVVTEKGLVCPKCSKQNKPGERQEVVLLKSTTKTIYKVFSSKNVLLPPYLTEEQVHELQELGVSIKVEYI